jgi:hypothetical protein
MSRTLPLIVARDIEPQRSFDGITSPLDLAVFLARIMAVDTRSIERLGEVYVGSVEPTESDRKLIWINTSPPMSFAYLVGGQYKHIYQYPANIPFIWASPEDPPSYLRRLTGDELTDMSLTEPTNSDYYYLILEV